MTSSVIETSSMRMLTTVTAMMIAVLVGGQLEDLDGDETQLQGVTPVLGE